MNIRHAVLCERLRARNPDLKRQPMTEEQLLRDEENLGYRLPAMLRMLYLTNGPGDLRIQALSEQGERTKDYARRKQVGEVQEQIDDAVLRLAPELVEAMRQQPGTYISLGEDSIPDDWPHGFVQLIIGTIYGDVGIVLDLERGHVYIEEPNYEWSHLSFCAPSVEDWLERELDGGYLAQSRYYPHEKLSITLEGGWLRPAASSPPAKTQQQEQAQGTEDTIKARRVARRETKRLREETLSIEEVDALERQVDWAVQALQQTLNPTDNRLLAERQRYSELQDGDMYAQSVEAMQEWQQKMRAMDPDEMRAQLRRNYQQDSHARIQHIGWEIKQTHRQLLRQMYALMEVLEDKQDELWEEGEDERPDEDKLFLEGLRPLIEVDAQLALLTESTSRGISVLYRGSGSGRGLPHRNRWAFQRRFRVLSESGRYAAADKGYEQALADAETKPADDPELAARGFAELWFGRAVNERRWAQTEAKAGDIAAARTHLAQGVRYAQQAVTLVPKNRRYPRVLASLHRALAALEG